MGSSPDQDKRDIVAYMKLLEVAGGSSESHLHIRRQP